MPKFTGTVPLEGSIKTSIRGDTHVCIVALSSSVANEIRLLRVSSTHVVSNHMTMQMQVICFAVPEADKVYEIPRNIEQFSFTVAPHLQKRYVSIWHFENVLLNSILKKHSIHPKH